MTEVPLTEFALRERNSIVDGPFGSDLKASEYVDHGIPIIRLQNIRPNEFLHKDIKFVSNEKAATLSRHSYRPGDIVITKLGDPCGVACRVPDDAGEGIIVADVVRVRPDISEVDPRFLVHAWNSPTVRHQIEAQTRGTTRPRVNLSLLKEIKCPKPSIEEQRRIADILDRADALRRKREEAIKLTDDLLRATFLDMFGDPTSNPKGWPTRRLGECVSAVQIGPFGSLLHESDYIVGGIPLVNPMHIRNGSVEPDSKFSVSREKSQTLAIYHLKAGDVILGRRGEMGRCALITEVEDGYLCGTGSLFIRPDLSHATGLYLAAFLSSKSTRAQLERAAQGATLPNLNRSIVENLRICLPPVQLQLSYGEAVIELDSIRARFRKAAECDDMLCSALQTQLLQLPVPQRLAH